MAFNHPRSTGSAAATGIAILAMAGAVMATATIAVPSLLETATLQQCHGLAARSWSGHALSAQDERNLEWCLDPRGGSPYAARKAAGLGTAH